VTTARNAADIRSYLSKVSSSHEGNDQRTPPGRRLSRRRSSHIGIPVADTGHESPDRAACVRGPLDGLRGSARQASWSPKGAVKADITVSVSPQDEPQTWALRVRCAHYGHETRQVKHLATYGRAASVHPRGVHEVWVGPKSTITGATLLPPTRSGRSEPSACGWFPW
jgi:hypothetical protein